MTAIQLYEAPPIAQGEWDEFQLMQCGNSYGIGINAEAYEELQQKDWSVPYLADVLADLLRLHQNPDGLVGVGHFLKYVLEHGDVENDCGIYEAAEAVCRLIHGICEHGRQVGLLRRLVIIRPRKSKYRHLF